MTVEIHLEFASAAAAAAAVVDPSSVREYCEDETFVADCGGSGPGRSTSSAPTDQVVVIDNARYGRMRIERCLMSTYGASAGCSRDILVHLDSMCSGRPHCEFNVRDLLVHNPCQKDLRGYLEAKFRCVKVISPESSHHCRHRAPVQVNAPSGYLSNYVTQQTGCGGVDSPWNIRASPGQRINITLLDFGWNSSHGGGPVCQVLAIIKDRAMGHSETVCQARTRISHVHYALSHDVEIRMLLTSNREDQGRYFLFKYTVEGCPDVETTRDMWFRRTSTGGAEAGCADLSIKWRLVCENDRWTGNLGNCSDESVSSLTGFTAHGLLHLPVGVNILIVAAVAGPIGICVLVGGLIVLRRKLAADKMANQTNFEDLYIQKSNFTGDLCRIQSEEEEEGGGGGSGPILQSGIVLQGSGTCSSSTLRADQKAAAGCNRSSWELKGLRGPPGPLRGSDERRSPSITSSFRLQGASDVVPPRYVDHIYESPTSIRRAFGDSPGGQLGAGRAPIVDVLQYYEVYEETSRAGPNNIRIAL